MSSDLKGFEMGIKIIGTGSYLPPKVVTNGDIAKVLDTTDEWIYSHTGIRSRHVAEDGECTSTMAAKAGASDRSSGGSVRLRRFPWLFPHPRYSG